LHIFDVRFVRLTTCPNKIVKDMGAAQRVEGPDRATAQKSFEDDLDKNLEAQADINCGSYTCDKGKCKFDYVLGDIDAKQLRAPGKKTKKFNITVADGLWEFTTVVSVGCWCVETA
jgi:hypothetical protein